MEELLTLVSSHGFPMVMSVYLLVRFEQLIRGLKESVDSLSLLVAVQSENQVGKTTEGGPPADRS